MIKNYSLVIGSGSIGERHASNLAFNLNLNVLVLSRNPQNLFRNPTLNSSSKVKKISKFDLKDYKNIELLILATPSSIRSNLFEDLRELIIKSIYVEVPAAISYGEWDKLKSEAKESNSKLYAGYNMRFHPAIENLKSLKNREFLSLRGVFGEFLPSLHKWENYKNRYEALNALGGGPLLTSHHEIDLAIYLMGNVDKVSCIFRNTSLDIDAPDHAILNLFHCNGAISNLDLNFYYRKYVRNFQIATTQDMISYEPFGNGLKIGTENYINYKDFDFNQTYVDAVNEALNNKTERFPTLMHVDHLMRVTDACLKSSKEDGKIIKVND